MFSWVTHILSIGSEAGDAMDVCEHENRRVLRIGSEAGDTKAAMDVCEQENRSVLKEKILS